MRCPKCSTENPPDARLCVNCQEILPPPSAWQKRPEPTPGQSARYCVSCGRSISWEANVCPYCGHNYMTPAYPKYPMEETVSSGMKILLYILSLFIPIAGIIIGVIFLTKQNPENKHIGKMCIVFALLSVVITVALSALLYVLVLGFGT